MNTINVEVEELIKIIIERNESLEKSNATLANRLLDKMHKKVSLMLINKPYSFLYDLLRHESPAVQSFSAYILLPISTLKALFILFKVSKTKDSLTLRWQAENILRQWFFEKKELTYPRWINNRVVYLNCIELKNYSPYYMGEYKGFLYSALNNEATICSFPDTTEKIIIPKEVDKNRVVTLESFLFEFSTVEEVVLPNSVTTLGDAVFRYSHIKTIILSTSLTEIPASTFEQCEKLESIILPQKIKKIGTMAFSQCSQLKEILLPASIQEIGESAFIDCKNLISVRITRTIKIDVISDYAFSGCINLKDFFIPKSISYIGKNAFEDCINCVFLVTENSYAQWYCSENKLQFKVIQL